MNLLKETLEEFAQNNKTENDIIWVGCEDFKTTWENFKEVADIEYDNGFGSPKVAEDLIIMGNDFWLERHEYDGSEWWEYKSKDIHEPKKEMRIKAVTVNQADELGYDVSCGWESLARINGLEND